MSILGIGWRHPAGVAPRSRAAVWAAVNLGLVTVLLLIVSACGAPQSGTEATGAEGTDAGAATSGSGAPPAQVATADHAVKRGRYLVVMGSCGDCHTPFKMGENGPEPDLARWLSGHPEEMGALQPPELGAGPWQWAGTGTNTAFAGPWGVSYAPNLTPDEATGMGIWTQEMFVQAMRTGRHFGQSRPIMPPMPWPNLAQATDEDLHAIYAYLRSLPPIHNRVPDYQPPVAPAG